MTPIELPGVKEAQFHTLHFASLLLGNKGEFARLLDACENDGFFYLDLRDWESGKILQQLDLTGKIMKQWFAGPLEDKLKTETVTQNHGYKSLGLYPGVMEKSRDSYEGLRLSRTNLLNQTHLPDVVSTNLDKFQQYMHSANYVLLKLLECLSTAAGVQDEERYELYHPPEQASKTAMLFLHYPEATANESKGGHNSHTDAGTLTLLFVDSPGLQVLSPKTNQWEYVSMKPGHAIVNVGDTLRFVSKKRFRSILHRVVLPDDRVTSRYATAYFLRAGDQVVFRGLNGEKFTAEEWFDKKYDSFEKTLQEQESNPVATGGMAQDLGVRVV